LANVDAREQDQAAGNSVKSGKPRNADSVKVANNLTKTVDLVTP